MLNRHVIKNIFTDLNKEDTCNKLETFFYWLKATITNACVAMINRLVRLWYDTLIHIFCLAVPYLCISFTYLTNAVYSNLSK
jgi:hypothetical protein